MEDVSPFLQHFARLVWLLIHRPNEHDGQKEELRRSLMQLSATLGALAGVRRASAVMASAANLDLLRDAGLSAGDVAAGPNDLLIAIEGEEGALADAMAAAEAALAETHARSDGDGERRRLAPRSAGMALDELPAANLVLISTPGEYAAAEAWKALRLGLVNEVVPVYRRGDGGFVPNPMVVTERFLDERGQIVYGEWKAGAERRAAEHPAMAGGVDDLVGQVGPPPCDEFECERRGGARRVLPEPVGDRPDVDALGDVRPGHGRHLAASVVGRAEDAASPLVVPAAPAVPGRRALAGTPATSVVAALVIGRSP